MKQILKCAVYTAARNSSPTAVIFTLPAGNIMAYRITTQRELRAEFWADNPDLPRRRIRNYSGNGKMYPTDTRCAWCDWLDYMQRSGQISDDLANRATLCR